jgi:2-phospho-L-lactate guanylyltransferase
MSSGIVAVVPIRSWQNGKTRLASVLSSGAREALMRRAATGVVQAAVASGAVDAVLVVSPDPAVLGWAGEIGSPVLALEQLGALPGLNGAIEAGRNWAQSQSADGILSLFADLPLLEAGDVRSMTTRPEDAVFGPDRNSQGTNALLLRTRGAGAAFRFAFGQGSLARHEAEAKRLGLTVAREERMGIAFDVDTPQDWTDFLETMSEIGLYPAMDGVSAG